MTIWRTLTLAALATFGLAAGAAECPPPAPTPSAAQLAAAARQDRGVLWRVERDGRVSHLYGTLHVGKAEWMQPGPAVRAALAASDVVALEIDPADPALSQLSDPADAAPLPPALQARLARATAAACLPEGALAALPPALQGLVLTLMEARWLGLDPALAQEQVLAHQARAAGRPLVALETVALQKQVLVPADPADAETALAGTLDEIESGRGRAVLERLATAWAAGDLATLERYEEWCGCVDSADDRAALRTLNDERNPAMAARIEALHREGRRVFAAVGALHMTGPQGLPKLLAERGFAVQRVGPTR